MGASLMQRTNKLKGIVEGMTRVLKTTHPAPLFPGTLRQTRTATHTYTPSLILPHINAQARPPACIRPGSQPARP